VPRAKQRTPELRDRVLRVALATLTAEGAAGFTTRRVAQRASTSTPAVYELFGDRAGLVREMFFEGFRQLGTHLGDWPQSGEPRRDLIGMIHGMRAFALANPALWELMFTRPFTDFDPGPDDVAAGGVTRGLIVGRVRRCIDAGVIAGDATDVAHVVLALAQGLALQETGGWLGTSQASADRRWELAIGAMLAGLAAGAAR
jgi:AcrR family transcriptional regulator